MLRSLSFTTRLVAATAAGSLLAAPCVVRAQDTRPVVAILSFDNNSIGKDRSDYDGLGKGIQDLLITDMASNPRIRLVDRGRIQEVLQEQNLVKAGAIDQSTAVQVGKILGAQYMIYGGFMSDGRGNMVLTAHATNVQTSQLSNAMKVMKNTDDALALVTEMTDKLNSGLKLAAIPSNGAQRLGDAGPAGPKTAPTQSGAPAKGETAPGAVEQYAQPLAKPMVLKTTKLDIGSMKIYANAIDEMDKKNNAKAIALFKQVVQRYPAFEPAINNLEKLGVKDG